MNVEQREDVKEVALKIDKIYHMSPEKFNYLKGWIHCLSQDEAKQKKTKNAEADEHAGRIIHMNST